mmetsp:Transcript_31030/g.70093  ORF Transcript_31030/g.70093 Transcript_31030/m.70093 type:complete len:258 (-) Transcript_31030:368-1141(-)
MPAMPAKDAVVFCDCFASSCGAACPLSLFQRHEPHGASRCRIQRRRHVDVRLRPASMGPTASRHATFQVGHGPRSGSGGGSGGGCACTMEPTRMYSMISPRRVEMLLSELLTLLSKRQEPSTWTSSPRGAGDVKDGLLLLFPFQSPAVKHVALAHEHRGHRKISPRHPRRAAKPREESPLGGPRQLSLPTPFLPVETIDGVREIVKQGARHHPEAIEIGRVRLLLHQHEAPLAHRDDDGHPVEERDVWARADEPAVV